MPTADKVVFISHLSRRPIEHCSPIILVSRAWVLEQMSSQWKAEYIIETDRQQF
jgi:hypothetical protein